MKHEMAVSFRGYFTAVFVPYSQFREAQCCGNAVDSYSGVTTFEYLSASRSWYSWGICFL